MAQSPKRPGARSRLTTQGQVSVPARVREQLGVGPGSVLEWAVEGDRVAVRRVGTHSSADVHGALFPDAPTPHPLDALKDGIRRHVRSRHARD